MGPQSERTAELAQSICRAVLDGGRAWLPGPQDWAAVLPLAILRLIGMVTAHEDCARQVAAAEALLRHVGRALLSASYDRAAISGLFQAECPLQIGKAD
jgi:hypothetical protein